MANELAGKSVIVTGAANGFGLAVARRFVRAGASVVMADHEEAKLDSEVAALTSEEPDGRAIAFVGDLREKLSMTNLIAATIDANDGIDILVNAARLLLPSDPLAPETDHFEETLQHNVLANLRLSQIAARRMIEHATEETPTPSDRAIVNLSSVFGRRALPELFAYSVSCATLEQLTRCLALAFAGEMAVGTTEAIFSISRTAGWLAHAHEEADEPPLRFRGRTRYRGPRPDRRAPT